MLLIKANDYWDKYRIKKRRKAEINKFKDPKRIKIYSKITLSSEQEKEIDDIYINNYGEKIPYTWHKHFTAFTGEFDKYYFPELLFIPELEKYFNNNSHYAKTFEDKNVLSLLASSADIIMPKTIYSCIGGIIQDNNHNIVSSNPISELNGEFFIKPTIDSCSGVGCQVLKLSNGVDNVTGKSVLDIVADKGLNWVIQERVKCHSSIAKIYPNSVNTFRIMTYIWKDKIQHVPIIMRIGQGGANVDNAHAGGMFIAVDDNGSLHEKAFTEFKKEFKKHPDTGLIYSGYKIDLVPKVIEAAEKCHSLIPQIGCINWDFTINDEGNPVLIEANIQGGSVWLFQMAHGKGIFGDLTPEILRWMRHMKNISNDQRSYYRCGNNFEK
ncbi:sugar-transfer associated ATP-grasp domain-containing protein [Ruminococcus sp. YRD2003]|uniref:sugar-transfer associated ATP-grasp domain-containing protein n=1 Tax=Ruminococcus sp. YRD2003 TaxID=1452313 RepID=UPI0015A59983